MRIPRTFQQYLLMAVVLPLSGKVAVRAAAGVRARGGSEKTAMRLEKVGYGLQRGRRRRGRRW